MSSTVTIEVDTYGSITVAVPDAPVVAVTVPSTPAIAVSVPDHSISVDATGPGGPSGEVSVGTTTTLPPGSQATVTDRDPSFYKAVLDFGIPEGIQGVQGEVAVGSTTTLAPGSPATVTDSDPSIHRAVLDFGIPSGIQGVQGEVAVGTTQTLAPGSQATVTDSDPSIHKAVLNFGIPAGIQGVQGEVSVGTTQTLAPGTPATVTDSDPSIHKAVLNFGIPQGLKGDQGIQGIQGLQGEVAVGTTTTLAPGSPATVTDTDASPNRAVLDFGIPQGLKGDKGDKGDTGSQGPPGELSQATADARYVNVAGDTMTGNLGLAELVQLVMATPGSTVKGRLQTLPGTPDWLGYTLNCKYDPTGWLLDDTSKKGWFFKLDSRTTQNPEFAVYCIPAGANPHVDEYPVLRVAHDGTVTVRGKVGGVSEPVAGNDAATKNYTDTHPWVFAPGVKQLPAGTSFDAVMATGFYDMNSPVGAPGPASWWYLEVLGHSNDPTLHIFQRATALAESGVPVTYTRRKYSGVWTGWEKQAGASGFVAKTGDTMTGNLTVQGDVTTDYVHSTWGGDMGGQRVTSVGNPVDPNDAVNMAWALENGGTTEVFVGPTEPTDPEILLWVDTDAAAGALSVESLYEEVKSLRSEVAALRETVAGCCDGV